MGMFGKKKNSFIAWLPSATDQELADGYESRRLEGVFQRLFKAGVSTICLPVNLFELKDSATVTALFCPVPKMTQIPCRVIAEV